MRPTTPAQHRFSQLIAFLLLLFIFPSIQAATNKTDEPLPSIEALEGFDGYRDTASRQVTRFANWIDNFFADDRIYDEQQGSYIKLNLLQTYFENDEPLYDAQIKARLDIPKTQKRVQLFIESDDADEDDTKQTSIDETLERQEQSIGLQFFQFDSTLWKMTTITGIRFRSGLDPFARLRFRRLAKNGAWIYRFTESIFWFDSEGAGETTRFDIDHTLTKNLLVRSTTQATWKNINQYFDLRQDLILFQNISKHKSIAYQTGISGIRDSQYYTTNYFYSVRYRQQLHNKWLYFDVIPAVNHPIINDYKPVRSITLKFEIIFGAN